MEDKLDIVLQELKSIRADISNVKSDISNMKADISNVKADISNVKSDISNMKADMVLMKDGQTELSRIVSNMKKEQEVIAAKLEGMEKRFDGLATKEDIEFLAEKLGRHDLELDRLKRIK